MKLNILSPERKLVTGLEVDSVMLTGAEGLIEILPGHAPMVTTLETGEFSFSGGGKAEAGFASSGFAEVKDDEVTVLAETLELRSEIDLSRARAAQRKSEEMLQAADLDETKFRKYELKLKRSMIRQQIAGSG